MIKKLFGFGVLLFILLIGSSLILKSNLSFRIAIWRINLNISGFKLISYSQDKTSFSKVEKLEAVSGTTQIKIHRINIDDHKKYIADKQFVLESLFLATTSPYPEVITNIIECPDEFKPKVRETNNGVVYTLFANERLNFGVCSKDLIKYHSEYGIFDCNKKGVFEIFVFSTDDKKIKEVMGSFKC